MKYLVKETSFVNHALVQAGDIVDYDLPEGTTISSNLEPVEEDPANPEPVKRGKGAKQGAPADAV